MSSYSESHMDDASGSAAFDELFPVSPGTPFKSTRTDSNETFSHSLRRFSGSNARMDASGAMHRLRVSMVGGTGSSSLDGEEDGIDEQRIPLAPTLAIPHNDTLGPATTDGVDLWRDKNNKSGVSGHHGGGQKPRSMSSSWFIQILGQIPAIALIGIFHLMIGVPFGVSYFPMQWTSHQSGGDVDSDSGADPVDGDLPVGSFPIPGKEAFGIRLFLFSTFVGQVVFSFFSGFHNPIGLQMVENIGFTKELSAVAIAHQGYGLDALATLMVMFGLASILVGAVFYMLGRFQLGKIVYFFPTHVLIGLIGGIGILLCKTGMEVTIADAISIPNLVHYWKLWIVIVGLEALLRLLEWTTSISKGKPRFALLSPVFFCMITPFFYLVLWSCHIPVSTAEDAGYFFPSLVHEEDQNAISGIGINFGTPWDVWKVIDFSKVSWVAILDSLPTMLALILFSLIHVPINIPAFALSTKVDVDMNQELVAHGYSNMIAGIAGGLQNYMAYTQSVLYDKSGGTGRVSGMAVAGVTGVLFFVGPTIASYVPRCMAGTLLLHVGIDLFLEGVYDSLGKFDWLEYGGIWLIVLVMSFYGMEAAMVAGGIAAVSTYAVQSVAYLNPIRGIMPATTLRSSHWYRSHAAEAVLENPVEGRNRILVVQLQGHLFFGNMAYFTEQIHGLLKRSKQYSNNSGGMATIVEDVNDAPLVVIMDFSLVLSIDSSAAHAIVKLKDIILKQYDIQLCIFVTGSMDGFPTEYKLRDQLSPPMKHVTDVQSNSKHCPSEESPLLTRQHQEEQSFEYVGSRVCDSLDLALTEAEDALIARQNPCIVEEDNRVFLSPAKDVCCYTVDEERAECTTILKEICPQNIPDDDAALIISLFTREAYKENEKIWVQGDESDSVKLLVLGQLISELENEAGTTEVVARKSIIGELGLVNGNPRMSTLRCTSEEAVLYSMSRFSFEQLIERNPRVARYIDLICVKYLALRVQHVSNRIFETRCLPI